MSAVVSDETSNAEVSLLFMIMTLWYPVLFVSAQAEHTSLKHVICINKKSVQI